MRLTPIALDRLAFLTAAGLARRCTNCGHQDQWPAPAASTDGRSYDAAIVGPSGSGTADRGEVTSRRAFWLPSRLDFHSDLGLELL